MRKLANFFSEIENRLERIVIDLNRLDDLDFDIINIADLNIQNSDNEIDYILHELDYLKSFRNHDVEFSSLINMSSCYDCDAIIQIENEIKVKSINLQDNNETLGFVLTIYGYDFSMIDEYSQFKIAFIIE